jgi:hypothetical protein
MGCEILRHAARMLVTPRPGINRKCLQSPGAADLTNYDLDLAQRWWTGTADIDPRKPNQLVSAIVEGFSIHDLGQVVQGRTIAEYLHAGYSVEWCVHSTGNARPDPHPEPPSVACQRAKQRDRRRSHATGKAWIGGHPPLSS